MALTEAQARRAARKLAREIFEQLNATATFSTEDLRAVIDSFETAFGATTNQIQTAYPNTVFLTALINNLPEPFKSNSTAGQKAVALSYWALEKAGLLSD